MNSIIKICIDLLEFLFCAGAIGSVLVILLTSLEDTKEMISFEKHDGDAETLLDTPRPDVPN